MTTDRFILRSMRAADGGARLLLMIRVESECGGRDEALAVFTARLPATPRLGTLAEEQYAFFVREAQMTKAMDMGLRFLGAGSASRLQLVRKMLQRGIKKDIAEAAVEALFARGCLFEQEGALSEAHKGLRKLWGDRRILADVRAKGYGAEAIAAVEALLKSENAPLRCANLIKKRRMVVPDEDHAVARFVASLVRYGYTVKEIKQALRGTDDT